MLLDGGPSCAFSDLDIPLMEDDLNMLKVSVRMLYILLVFFASSSVHQSLHLALLIPLLFVFSHMIHHFSIGYYQIIVRDFLLPSSV